MGHKRHAPGTGNHREGSVETTETILGRYRTEKSLGEGGMGAVYEAYDLKLRRRVAIKRVHPTLLGSAAARSRFVREALVLARLAHPNIVNVFDFDPEAGVLVMELVHGVGVDTLIRQAGGPMPPALCAWIASEVLLGVGYAHAYRDEEVPDGIIHRDIKPSNILVATVGERDVVKVVDFGLAKFLGEQDGMTKTRGALGTRWYMSPEQVRSPKYVGTLTDIYAIGVTLYEMLTGRVPLDGDSDYDVMRAILQDDPVPPSSLVEGLPPELDAVVLKAMARDPAERYPSCAAFREAIQATHEDRPAGPGDSVSASRTSAVSLSLELEDISQDNGAAGTLRPIDYARPTDPGTLDAPGGTQNLSQGQVSTTPANAGARHRTPVTDSFTTPSARKWVADLLDTPEWKWTVGLLFLLGLALVLSRMTCHLGGVNEPVLPPDRVLEQIIAAENARDARKVASYYASRIQWFNRRWKTNDDLLRIKLNSFRGFDLKHEDTVHDVQVAFNDDRTQALLTFRFMADWIGSSGKAFYCDVDKRMRMVLINGAWKVNCEEDIYVRQASNRNAEGTDICWFQ